jgi:hypothetical protein
VKPRYLFRRPFETFGIVSDACAGIVLVAAGPYINRTQYSFPWLSILDLKMPIVDGFGVLLPAVSLDMGTDDIYK